MIFEDELDLLGFSEEENDHNQATVKRFRERQYFELENFTERFRLTREQVELLVNQLGDLIGPNGHMARNHPLSALDKVLLASVLLGDSGYALRDFLQTPIPNPQTPAENRYNAAHKRTRSRIECAIGQLKNSWRCLSKLRVKDPAYAAEIIKAVIVLHNRRMDENPEDLPTQEEEEDDECPPEEMGTAEARAAGKQKQTELINFFVR
ncbi:DDE superfamily endonuclease domain-containing protein [Ditylenchus destructor]|uniref:DDE superfamily endonuclease domain-containing protein n=1 Tax=Ditylenchus destructor TaxID=166010 RepID=A0AAD4MTZ5_9BILA|nr:DDE superfamily endonuclease domain-containing protein [Ditylenchus destructor]KAI1715363.1 DDE superfamily endonuclease domain-containing protein [Ditylenchus destructor]